MVNFLAVIDSQVSRRLLFIKKITPFIQPVEGLSIFTCANRDLSVIWAAGSWTPTTSLNDEEGLVLAWGDVIEQNGSERISAKQIRVLWNTFASELPNAFDGFHVAFVYHPEKGIMLGADILGLFPVYYYASTDLLLVSSSPELFKYHPSFVAELNASGLVGIFLTNGLFDGETLLRDVKRLGAGRLLFWKFGKTPKEVTQFRLPVSKKYFNLFYSEQVDLLDKAIEKAVLRHTAPLARYCLMLSGGLDSRMLGGYMRNQGKEFTAFTYGLPSDIEAKCAFKVAQTLNVKHYVANVEFDKYPLCASKKIRWEHLSNGYSDVTGWGYYQCLREIAPRVVIGYLGDTVINASVNTFETFFENVINEWGFSPGLLERLLKKSGFDDLVSERIQNMKRLYEEYSDLGFRRTWCFFLNHRARFHIGGTAWVLTFGAWPVLPFVDSELMRVAGGMPLVTMLNRRAQKEILIRRFSDLSRLPVDRFSYDTTPLIPSTRTKLARYLYSDEFLWRYSKDARLLRHKILRLKGERRVNYRTYDFNNPGWVKIRDEAENYRGLSFRVFDEGALAKILPNSESKIKFSNGVTNSSSLKLLTGFLLWLSNNLQQVCPI